MRHALRFVVVLLIAIGLLAWGASAVVRRTTREWFEKDVASRAELALIGSRPTLLDHWSQGPQLYEILVELTRDERIMAAQACGPEGALRARTPDFPPGFGCRELLSQADPGHTGHWQPLKKVVTLPGGDAHLSVLPLIEDEQVRGAVVLLNDLSLVQRREATAQNFLLAAFGLLGLAAAVVTLAAARFSWRNWSEEFRRFLRGDVSDEPSFRPMLADVRELVERIAAEREADSEAGLWTAERLKHALNRYLHREKIVIVANREPYLHEHKNGAIVVRHPASGLVTALEPVMRACSGVWVAHGSGSADKEVVDNQNRVKVPPGEGSYSLRRVWLTPEEERGYYYGFSNEGLWPLCHLAHQRPTFRSEDFEAYRAVNAKFADAVMSEVDSEDAIIMVQDYHFALVPRLIRERMPLATIIMFWHIPWPTAERFGICPFREQLLEGMLGSSIVGFHTRAHCNNFLECADRFIEARIDREQNAVVQHGRPSLVRPYPISVEWPMHWVADSPPPAICRQEVFNELGLRRDALLGVGVDRLDYTKGIEERFLSVERLLERYPIYRGRFTFVQLAAPSRTEIERYQQLTENVERLVERINTRFGSEGYKPIVLLRAHHEPPTVFRYYRAADLCYVSSLHDGMNLVAKEFVSARDDERSVLVLSQFTGAAGELTEALLVNPYDLDEASDALANALTMSPQEQRDRMRAMRSFIAEFNVYRWAGRMLVDAGRLRNRDRLSGRLTQRSTLGRAV